jgi:CHRD domain/Secretion system C-terminal sorting domain
MIEMKNFTTLLFLSFFALPQLSLAQVQLSGTLAGTNEIPANASTAVGKFEGIFDPWSRVIAFRLEFSGLTANASAAHFHSAPSGSNGSVVLDFVSQGFPVGTKNGEFVKVLTLTDAQAVDLMNGNIYVNIHNPSFPGGEIRAQILYGAAPTTKPVPFSARLSGAQEVPANTSTAKGTLDGIFDPYSRVIAFRLEYSGLTANATASHFHIAAAGVNGGVTLDFVSQGFQTGSKSGEFVKVLTLTQAQADALTAGRIYVNIHNASFPGGEIRGQVNYNQPLNRVSIPVNGTLNGAQQVPINTTTASGSVVGSYDPQRGLLGIKVTYAGLTANATSAHIHRGAIGVNGPVQIDFGGLGFTFGAQSGTFSKIIFLNATQAADLLAGNLYVNIHNASFPGGEIRAQLNATVFNLNIPAEENIRKVDSQLTTALYPNPSSDHVFLNLGINNAPVNVELYDMQGRLVSSLKSSETLLKWDAATLAKGLYLFRVQKGQEVEVHKWLKN